MVVVEDHCGGRTLGAGTHVTKRLHGDIAVSRVPIERSSVRPGTSAATPLGTHCVEQQGESAIPRPVTCPRAYGDRIKVTGEGSLFSQRLAGNVHVIQQVVKPNNLFMQPLVGNANSRAVEHEFPAFSASAGTVDGFVITTTEYNRNIPSALTKGQIGAATLRISLPGLGVRPCQRTWAWTSSPMCPTATQWALFQLTRVQHATCPA